MTLHLQLNDPDGIQVIIRAPGNYNPDVLEDGKRRLMDIYKETLSFRFAIGINVPVEMEELVGEGDSGE